MANRTRNSKPAKSTSPNQSTAGAEPELLDMKQAIGLLKTTRPTFYRWLREGKIKGMKVGRQWRFERGDIERFLRGEEPRVELRADIGPLTADLAARLRRAGEPPAEKPDETPVQRVCRLIFALGRAMSASDVHVEPYQHDARLRCRVDGVLHPMGTFDIRLLPAVVEQLKRLAACDVRETRRPQDGRILIEDNDARRLDVRVNFLPAMFGESVTLRLLVREAVRLGLDSLGFAEADLARLRHAIAGRYGLVVVAGAAGSGKTTMIYSCLNELAGPGRKIISVEDPVEFVLDGVIQVGIRPDAGLDFARAMVACLRSAVNVIMLGEARNPELLNLCLQASLTGHVVLTTLHTDTAAGALVRMVEMGAAPFVIGDATRLVLSQRLVRKLCPDCAKPAAWTGEQTALAERIARGAGLSPPSPPRETRRATGCDACHGTGYRGRTPIVETLEVTPAIKELLREGADAEALRDQAVREGMTTMAADGVRRAAAGETTIDEVRRVLGLTA